MNIKAAMRELPEILRAVASERVEYDKVIREARWREGPVTIISQRNSVHAACSGAEALEWLLGWPAIAREAADFRNYSLQALRPRSVLIALSASGDDNEVIEATERANRQGANILALTANPESPLARIVRATLPLPEVKGDFSYLTGPLAEYAALLQLAATAASIFNPRNPHLEKLEFEDLPERIAWMEIHLTDPIRRMALEIKGCRRLMLTGGRFYYPAALAAATLARRITSQPIEALPLEVTTEFLPSSLSSRDAFLFLTSSHCKVKKSVHAEATHLKTSEAKLFAVTDANDRELIRLCDIALLIPDLAEITGSLLTLTLLQRLVLECATLAS